MASAAGTTAQPGGEKLFGVRIVGLVRMGGDPAGERSVDRAGYDIAAGDRSFGRSTLGAHVADSQLARPELSARDHGSQCVEQMVLCLFRDRGWNIRCQH